MPRQESRLEINQFTGGLNTDATELTSPPNTSKDELNFDLLKEGTRRRRRGMALEGTDTVNVGVTAATDFTSNHRWENINNNGDLSFEVIQVGRVLYFFDTSIDPLIAGLKAFTVNLDDHKAPLASSTDNFNISVSSGKGALFVCGEALTPFYIQYNATTDTISVTSLLLKIRDLTQLDTQPPETGALTAQRRYDLLNQGWHQEGVIIGSSTQIKKIVTTSKNPNTSIDGFDGAILDGYIETFGGSPPKTKPWWIGKGTITVDIRIKKPGIFNDTKETREVEAFSKEAFDLYYGGNTVAPLGHYIVDPFYKDRAAVSGVQSLAAEIVAERPGALAFYGGRVFYGLNNTIYFSQVILDDLQAAERCYQEADPTAEDSIGLISSDGGVITIPDMGRIIRLFVVEGALLIFADNGVWTLYSPQGQGFSATNFAVDFVTNLAAVGYHSIVDVEGYPFYWGVQGIYSVVPIEERIAYQVTDLTDRKLKNFYNTISPLAKRLAKGAYDLSNRRVIWLWKSTVDPINQRFQFDRLLNYSVVFDAFFPYSIAVHDGTGTGSNKDIGVAGIVPENSFSTEVEEEQVCVDTSALSDPFASDVAFYYPLSLAAQYADRGPLALADATPIDDLNGTISSAFGLPLGSGYFAPSGFNGIILPENAVPSRGTGAWTFECWTNGNWEDIVTIAHGIFHVRSGDPAGGASYSQLSISTTGAGDVISVFLLSEEGNSYLANGITSYTDFTPVYISVTRDGSSVFVHTNGVLQITFNVGADNFNFAASGDNTNKKIVAMDNEVATLPMVGHIGEMRWTNTAKYSAAAYSPPTIGYDVFGKPLVPVIDNDSETVITERSYLTDSEIGLKFIAIQDVANATTGATLGFSELSSETFTDWVHTGAADGYESYIETFYHLNDNAMLYMQAPWIYTYIKRTSNTYPAAEGDGSIATGDVGGAL